MKNDDLCYLSIAEIGSLLRARTVSAVEVTEAHLARIERLNPTLNAFVTVMAAEARDAARRADAELAAGRWRGPLHGVPIGVKDIFDTAGVRTTHGSSFYRDNVPADDAESVRRLKEAGAILIGKCNTHEFAAGSTTNNPWYGPTRNPWALDRSPGGSSGGSGAAVAAFLCPGATGTDTLGPWGVAVSLQAAQATATARERYGTIFIRKPLLERDDRTMRSAGCRKRSRHPAGTCSDGAISPAPVWPPPFTPTTKRPPAGWDDHCCARASDAGRHSVPALGRLDRVRRLRGCGSGGRTC